MNHSTNAAMLEIDAAFSQDVFNTIEGLDHLTQKLEGWTKKANILRNVMYSDWVELRVEEGHAEDWFSEHVRVVDGIEFKICVFDQGGHVAWRHSDMEDLDHWIEVGTLNDAKSAVQAHTKALDA